MRAIHWFRSDLRLADNTSFTKVCEKATEVLPLFVLDKRLVGDLGESHPRVDFMMRCLHALDDDLRAHGSRLFVLAGEPAEILTRLCDQHTIEHVSWNRDYSPYAKTRDNRVKQILQASGVSVATCKDRVVFEANEVRKGDGGAYQIYTPYRRRWRELHSLSTGQQLRPDSVKPCPAMRDSQTVNLSQISQPPTIELPSVSAALATEALTHFLTDAVEHYASNRDRPDIEGTSRLSPFLRFGVLSVRQCLRMAGEARLESPHLARGIDTWVDELIWREFYNAVLDENPQAYSRSFRPEYEEVQWDNDEGHFDSWCSGRTGYPIVDAAMRQLNQTGWMHNRTRMVVASFLTKDLLIDWRWGERYFMQRLIDGDPASNNGGWQWAASTGTDAQPYFRIFNPIRQGERFDPGGVYVKRWVPELRDVEPKIIHHPRPAIDAGNGYPQAIVDHKQQRTVALERYKAAKLAFQERQKDA